MTDHVLSRRAVLGIAGGGALAAGTGALAVRRAHADDSGANLQTSAPVLAHTDKWAVIPTWSGHPIIDGRLTEALWADAATLDNFRTAYDDEPESGSGGPTYQAAVSGSHLFLGGTLPLVDRDTLTHIEIIISTEAAGTTHHVATIPVNPVGPVTTEWDRSIFLRPTPSRIPIPSWEHATAEDTTTNTFTVEIAIPFSSLGVATPGPTSEWRLNIVHIHRVNTRPMTSWYPIRTSRYMDRGGDTVVYSANVIDQGRLGSIGFGGTGSGRLRGDGSWTLSYTGFTSKHVEFTLPAPAVIPRGEADPSQLHLYWKGSDGPWTPLTATDAVIDASHITASFEHPPPDQAGSYQLRVAMSVARSAEQLLTILSFDREDLIDAGKEALAFQPPPIDPVPVTPAPPSATVLEILDRTPELTGFRYVGLPERPDLTPDGQYTLSADGRSLVADVTGTIYPNDRWAETESLTVTGRDGRTLEYPYHEDANRKRYFISGHLWYLQRSRAVSETEAVAQVDPLGAARLLHRFVTNYPGYVPSTDEAWHTFPLNFSSGYPFNYWGGVWSRWQLSDLSSLRPLVRAYAEVIKTDAFAVLSAEVGIDVERALVEGVFHPSVDYAMSYPVTLGNQDGNIMLGLIALGKALRDPDFIHRAIVWIRDYIAKRHLADGSWYEVAPSYHRESTAALSSAIGQVTGYSDPDGYLSPRSGLRLVDVDLARDYPIIEKVRRVSTLLAYPNRKTLPLRDTWANGGVATPDLEAKSILLPSAGVARLTRGTGANQSQLYLQFVPYYGHGHFDPLNITFFARGTEALPDLGYTHSKYRYPTLSTIGHNTVVVNSRDADTTGPAQHGGRIERFLPSSDERVHVVRARQQEGYPETEQYRRENWFVAFADDAAGPGYLVDIFRVTGGSRHEYVLTGEANRDTYLETQLVRSEYGPRLLPPGVTAVEATGQADQGSAEGHYPGYIYVKAVEQAEIPGPDYELTFVSFDTAGDDGKLSIVGALEDGENELYFGRSPSIRNTRLFGPSRDSNDDVELYDLPKMVHRRNGANLASSFVTMIESHGARSERQVEAIDRLTPDEAPLGAVAVRIIHGETTDLVVSNTGGPNDVMRAAGITLRGEMGFVRTVNGMITEMRLFGGTELTMGGLTLAGGGIVTGTVTGTTRVAAGDAQDGLVVDTAVPSAAVGHHVVLTHPDGITRGFPIAAVHPAGDGGSLIVLAGEDPGFTFTGDGSSRQTAYPGLQWAAGTVHTVAVALTAIWTGTPVAVPFATGSLDGTVSGPNGSPLAGAMVAVTGSPAISTATDGEGRFSLPAVPTGLRRVTVLKDGYVRAVSGPVVVAEGNSSTVAVTVPNEMPPTLSEVRGLVGVGDPVTATSSKVSDLYLVPNDTLPREEAIVAAAAAGSAVADVAAGQPTEIPTTGLQPGRYRLFAIDPLHNVSLGSPVVVVPLDRTVVDDNDDFVTYTGSWRSFSNSAYYGGTVMRGEAPGSTADILFYGTSVRILCSTSFNNGFADIYIDGELLANVDTYSATSKFQQELYQSATLDQGAHTLRIVATGEKREAAKQAFVSFDVALIG